jgi:hypothetical protein
VRSARRHFVDGVGYNIVKEKKIQEHNNSLNSKFNSIVPKPFTLV